MAVPVRIVTYNVHGLRDDLAALADTVRVAAPDVLVVQEAPRRWRWRQRCAELGRTLGMVVAAGGAPGLGNLILTNLRVAVADSWCVRFPLTPGRHMRGAVLVRCQIASVPLVVAGSHLSTDVAERPAQAGRLVEALAGLATPVALGVDINDEPGSPTWQALTSVLDDPVTRVGVTGDATFPAPAPRVRIDAMLVGRQLGVASYKVWDTPQARLASDHLPVVADLQV